jgi:hypothetical protein
MPTEPPLVWIFLGILFESGEGLGSAVNLQLPRVAVKLHLALAGQALRAVVFIFPVQGTRTGLGHENCRSVLHS